MRAPMQLDPDLTPTRPAASARCDVASRRQTASAMTRVGSTLAITGVAVGLTIGLSAGAAGAGPTKTTTPPSTAKSTRSASPTPPTTTRPARPTATTAAPRATPTTARTSNPTQQPATSLIASESPTAGAGAATATPTSAVEVSPGPPALLVAGPIDAAPETGKLLTPMTKLWIAAAAAAAIALLAGLLTAWYWRRTNPNADAGIDTGDEVAAGRAVGGAVAAAASPTRRRSSSRNAAAPSGQPAGATPAAVLLAARHWADDVVGWDEWDSTDWDRDPAWRPYDDAFLAEPHESDPPTSENRMLVGAG